MPHQMAKEGDTGTEGQLKAVDVLVFPAHKSVVKQYLRQDDGSTVLKLFCGSKEIEFDNPAQFAFGEALAEQSEFMAGTAMRWGQGFAWEQICDWLEILLAEGILQRAGQPSTNQPIQLIADGARKSPLGAAPAHTARFWNDCRNITTELTGRSLDVGMLEMVVPVFRVAHMALDSEGRQVGESNVFPKAMRIEVPTNWRTCIYGGTRYQPERPMNVSALKSMRAHWAQMLAALRHIRAEYLERFPQARSGWTVGHLERLSVVVLALPTYWLVKAVNRVENGDLSPVLSSLFRVTDGLRMTMHQMLFVPIGEPALAPDTPMTSAEVYAYAERNYSFHSEHGVCAGPKVMIEEFLSVLIDGTAPRSGQLEAPGPALAQALTEMDVAFDYGMLGLQVHAVVFSIWPAMTRAYEDIFKIFEVWPAQELPKVQGIRDQLQRQIAHMRQRTYLATEEWRAHRESSYAEMYAQCGMGLQRSSNDSPMPLGDLAEQLARPDSAKLVELENWLSPAIERALGLTQTSDRMCGQWLGHCIADFMLKTRAVLRAAEPVQARLNALLGRKPPSSALTAADIDIHNLLQGATERPLPYLMDEIQAWLEVEIEIDKDHIHLRERDYPQSPPNTAGMAILPPAMKNSAGIGLAG